MPYPKTVQSLIDDFRARRPMRTTSLIVTVFGDVVSQHGGSVWLGSLVDALAPLGVSERLVRTSVFRLVQEGWLEFDRVGRRSYYRFSEYGAQEYNRAAPQVYGQENSDWDGRWQLLILRHTQDKQAERFKRSLNWQGFRPIASGVFAKPGSGGQAMLDSLNEFSALDDVLVMEADTLPETSGKLMQEVVRECWRLDEVACGYKDFLQQFRPLRRWLKSKSDARPEAGFAARVLLIHEYRRMLLKDTFLPKQLLPSTWPGNDARELTSTAYTSLVPSSLKYITSKLESQDGILPAPGKEFYQRFR